MKLRAKRVHPQPIGPVIIPYRQTTRPDLEVSHLPIEQMKNEEPSLTNQPIDDTSDYSY